MGTTQSSFRSKPYSSPTPTYSGRKEHQPTTIYHLLTTFASVSKTLEKTVEEERKLEDERIADKFAELASSSSVSLSNTFSRKRLTTIVTRLFQGANKHLTKLENTKSKQSPVVFVEDEASIREMMQREERDASPSIPDLNAHYSSSSFLGLVEKYYARKPLGWWTEFNSLAQRLVAEIPDLVHHHEYKTPVSFLMDWMTLVSNTAASREHHLLTCPDVQFLYVALSLFACDLYSGIDFKREGRGRHAFASPCFAFSEQTSATRFRDIVDTYSEHDNLKLGSASRVCSSPFVYSQQNMETNQVILSSPSVNPKHRRVQLYYDLNEHAMTMCCKPGSVTDTLDAKKDSLYDFVYFLAANLSFSPSSTLIFGVFLFCYHPLCNPFHDAFADLQEHGTLEEFWELCFTVRFYFLWASKKSIVEFCSALLAPLSNCALIA